MCGMSDGLNETENFCTVEDSQIKKERKKDRREERTVEGEKETKEFE
jgi:hypothetical protein